MNLKLKNLKIKILRKAILQKKNVAELQKMEIHVTPLRPKRQRDLKNVIVLDMQQTGSNMKYPQTRTKKMNLKLNQKIQSKIKQKMTLINQAEEIIKASEGES